MNYKKINERKKKIKKEREKNYQFLSHRDPLTITLEKIQIKREKKLQKKEKIKKINNTLKMHFKTLTMI